MRNILILFVLTCAFFVSCKEEEEESNLVLKSVVQGTVTYRDEGTGQEGNASGATIKVHIGNAEESLKEFKTNNSGFYQIPIAVNSLIKNKIYYQLTGVYTTTIVDEEFTFTGRSDSISFKGNDTIVCNLVLEQ